MSYFFLLPLFASVVIDPNEGFLRSGNDPVLTVLSAGHALHVFVNGQLSGEEHNVFSVLMKLFQINLQLAQLYLFMVD
jgi:hypothetical protein